MYVEFSLRVSLFVDIPRKSQFFIVEVQEGCGDVLYYRTSVYMMFRTFEAVLKYVRSRCGELIPIASFLPVIIRLNVYSSIVLRM
jgi:hypothetical protein